jgi:predicted kinase
MPKIILCRGIQGSGKTTWAKQWVLEDPEHRVRFNNDDIRNMLGKYWVPDREHLVKADCIRVQFLPHSNLHCRVHKEDL